MSWRRTQCGLVFWVSLVTGIALAGSAAAYVLPDPPAPTEFILDEAGLLRQPARERIAHLQREAYGAHDTPIFVVTIVSMADYGAADASIEQFARAWFDHWQIGKRDADGRLIKRGILLLVSRDDRRLRIELGADWGRRWDRHCRGIVDGRIVPDFRDGRFSSGIEKGVFALFDMAKQGPAARAPRARLSGIVLTIIVLLCMGGAAVCLVLVGWLITSGVRSRGLGGLTGFATERRRRRPSRRWRRHPGAASHAYHSGIFGGFSGGGYSAGGSGGGYSGGGCSSGGYSGGGGASGSW